MIQHWHFLEPWWPFKDLLWTAQGDSPSPGESLRAVESETSGINLGSPLAHSVNSVDGTFEASLSSSVNWRRKPGLAGLVDHRHTDRFPLGPECLPFGQPLDIPPVEQRSCLPMTPTKHVFRNDHHVDWHCQLALPTSAAACCQVLACSGPGGFCAAWSTELALEQILSFLFAAGPGCSYNTVATRASPGSPSSDHRPTQH